MLIDETGETYKAVVLRTTLRDNLFIDISRKAPSGEVGDLQTESCGLQSNLASVLDRRSPADCASRHIHSKGGLPSSIVVSLLCLPPLLTAEIQTIRRIMLIDLQVVMSSIEPNFFCMLGCVVLIRL